MPEELQSVCLADISLSTIEASSPELCSVCDAVASGRLSAVLACERIGSASRGEKAYEAEHALGLLLRTLHLCDTLSIDDFRRETLRLLNHGEPSTYCSDRSGAAVSGPAVAGARKSW